MSNLKAVPPVLNKVLLWNSKPTEQSFPELPEVLIWFRFLIAVAYGTYLGMTQATNPTYLLQSLNLVAFVPLMYCKLYLGVQGEEFGMKIVFSGLFNAIALSFLIWVYFYTAAHETDELQLKELLLSVVDPSDATASMAEDVLEAAASVVTEESEF